MRDSQRQRLYNCEQVWSIQMGLGENTYSVAECQARVDSVLRTAWWKNRSGIRDITVRSSHGLTARAKFEPYNGHVITMGPEMRKQWVIMHELAHHLNPTNYNHGPDFCADYVSLVKRFLGEREGIWLRKQMVAHKVKCRGAVKPKSRRVRKVG